MDQDEQELIVSLKNKIHEQQQEIQWLRMEITRYKMLLEGRDVIKNSLPFPRPNP